VPEGIAIAVNALDSLSSTAERHNRVGCWKLWAASARWLPLRVTASSLLCSPKLMIRFALFPPDGAPVGAARALGISFGND
jgi:hypothetical protein